MSSLRIVIIGAGAVGGSIGTLLIESGSSVDFVARGLHGQQIRESGLDLITPDRRFHAAPHCEETISDIDWTRVDLAVVAVKLNDAVSVLKQLADAAGKQLPVLCATNGIHGELWAAERFATVLSMLVWVPATYLEAGRVLLHSANDCRGVLDIGPVSQTSLAMSVCKSVGQQLKSAGFDAVVRTDIQRWKYAKWITNLGGAAQALVTDDWQTVARVAREEGELVLSEAAVDRVATQTLLERTSHIENLPIEGQERLGGSTWQSLQRGKPLESRWIEGAMAALGRRIGVAAPINRSLSDLADKNQTVCSTDVLPNDG